MWFKQQRASGRRHLSLVPYGFIFQTQPIRYFLYDPNMNGLMILKHLHNFSEFQYAFPICLLTLHFRSHKCLPYLLIEMETGWLLNGMECHQMNFMIGICEKRVEMINFTLTHGIPQSVIKTPICLWHLKQRKLILYWQTPKSSLAFLLFVKESSGILGSCF